MANFSANAVTNGPPGTATPRVVAGLLLRAHQFRRGEYQRHGWRRDAGWAEYIAGTDSTNALSCLRMHTLATSSGATGVLIGWESVTGKLYVVDRCTNLLARPPFINSVSNIVGQVNYTTYTDTNAAGSGPYYYRVGVQ